MVQPPRKTWGYCPVRWLNRHAIVAVPEHFDLTNVREIREQLLAIVNREVLVLVVDMSETVSCDHAGSDALARVYQRALASGTELRLVVTGALVRRVLSINGVDRLISIYPTAEIALAVTVPSESAWAVLAGEAVDVGVEVALLDPAGVIEAVNEPWQAFTLANGGDLRRVGVGVSNLEVCDTAGDDPGARQAAGAIRAALAGDLPGTLTLEVPCHSPRTVRWFDMLISARRDDDGRIVGAAVTLSLTRSETRGLLHPGAYNASCRDLLLGLTNRLFSVGQDLQAGVRQAEDPLATRLRRAVGELDDIIRDARSAVYRAGPAPEEGRLAPMNHHAAHTRR
jgi:anti-anti-sigma factor